MTMTNDAQQTRRRVLEAARREQQEAAVRARENLADLERALAAVERLEAVDSDLERQIAAKTAELRTRAEGRRGRELRSAGGAFAAMRDRGASVKDIARQGCVPERAVREAIAAFEAAVGAPGKDASPAARPALAAAAAAADEKPADPAAG